MLVTSFAANSDPNEVVRALTEISAIGIGSNVDRARVEVLIRDLGERVRLLEAPLGGSGARLAAADRDEAKAALEAAEVTLRRAHELGAQFVVLRFGAIDGCERDWIFARDRFIRGALDPQLALRLLKSRQALVSRALDAARRALDRLAAQADEVTLLIACPRRYVELPLAGEIDLLTREFAGAPVGPMLDVANAHLLDQMGFQPLALSVASSAGPLVYWGDACGPVGALEPGRGIVDLPALAAQVKAARAFRPWAGLSLAESLQAYTAIMGS